MKSALVLGQLSFWDSSYFGTALVLCTAFLCKPALVFGQASFLNRFSFYGQLFKIRLSFLDNSRFGTTLAFGQLLLCDRSRFGTAFVLVQLLFYGQLSF